MKEKIVVKNIRERSSYLDETNLQVYLYMFLVAVCIC